MQLNSKILAVALATALFGPIVAHSQAPAPAAKSDAKTAAADEMTSGEVQKVDKDAGKLTIKHGEIKNLAMPPMTMVFTAKDKAMVNDVKAGQKIRFKVVSENGKMLVTEIQPEK